MGILFSNPINSLVFQADQSSIKEEEKYVSKIIGPNESKIPIYEKIGSVKKCIIISHGNASKLSKEVPMANLLHSKLNVTVVCYEYPGYGYTQKWNYKPTERGCCDNLKHVVDYVRGNGFTDDNIILHGTSLGTGVTVDYASQGFGGKVVLMSPFKSIAQVAYDSSLLYPIDMFRSIDKIDKVKNPVLFIHGEADDLIHYTHTIELYKKHTQSVNMHGKKPIKPVIVKNADHNDVIHTLGFSNYVIVLSDYIHS